MPTKKSKRRPKAFNWRAVESVHSHVVELSNVAMKAGCHPAEVFAALLLSVISVGDTAPKGDLLPDSFDHAMGAAKECLGVMTSAFPEGLTKPGH